ncbi:Helix-turn-helix domain-containing protein [Friedmanniella luteola]|uniref:Helix-turn-helix domain-containing protein n=1 Tax=Friedmanniella luteola TaxID=546871 RepID=A0A1H1WA43_9ACTN|nr:helix-turn-helix transcriptional regulator [Friedmanniella luteola]SDS93541.1 Helix-turn-helix domain-containing protein [Friedmanniella luteola]
MGELLPFRRADRSPSASTASSGPGSRSERDAVVGRVRPPANRPGPPEPLWREAAGEVLREQRHRLEQTLAEVARRAGISVQYLSEVERGRKEPSSEVLAAVTGALQLSLVDLTRLVLRRLTPLDVTSRRSGPGAPPSGPVARAA